MILMRFLVIIFTLLIATAKGSESEKPRIGILTSGGDCSGLNSIIYAAYKRATILGYDVIGFKYGVHGLINDDYVILNSKLCPPDILRESGSILRSNTKILRDKSGKKLTKKEGDNLIIKEYHKLNLKGLIYIGGDGSIGVIKNILKKDSSLNMIALPKTIDNDINNTYVSVGFSTATKVAAKEISNIISTAKSHSRIMVIEVMGRGAGYIALTAGLASGADAIIVPEIKCDIKKLISKIKSIYDEKGYAIVVISEGVEFDKYKYKNKKLSDTISRKNYGGVSNFLANQLKQAGFDAKSVILGHTQRGGCTSVEDRILGIKFGAQAVNLIHNNDTGYLLGTDGSKIVKTKLSKIKTTTRNLTSDSEDITVAKNLGIFIGE